MYEDRIHGVAAAAWRRAAASRAHAAAAVEAAVQYDLLAQRMWPNKHRRLAARKREAVAHHLAAAEIQEAYARRLSASLNEKQASRPLFMSTVAAVCGADCGVLVLLDESRLRLAVASSDARAEKAQDLEYVLGEGPACDVARTGRAVAASGSELVASWPNYGPGILALGLQAAAAVPLTSGAGKCFGVMAVFDQRRLPARADLRRIATALTKDILLGRDGDPQLYGNVDEHPVVHQATGMVGVQEDCSPADALDLIKARAFLDGTTTDDVARRIVHSGLRLTDGAE